MGHSKGRVSFRTIRVVVALAFLVALVPAGTPAAGAGKTAAASSGKTVKTFFTNPDLNGKPKRPGFDPTAVNVKWNPGVPSAQRAAAAAALGFKVTDKTRRFGWQRVEPTTSGLTADQLISTLKKSGLVTRAERSATYTTFATPNDPLFSQQWSLKNTGQNDGTAGADIGATTAWDATTGTAAPAGPVVAVVDTGVMWNHPDLRANIWTNPKEIPNNGVDDDKNGYVDDYRGYDFANNDTTVFDPTDGDEHGTHVAGTIGAVGNNGVGITGVAWKARIMPVKAFGAFGASDLDLADALTYAVDNGAKFINCSWGGPYSAAIDDAVKYAATRGAVLVCASGNSFSDNDSWPTYPASYEATNIVAVGATDKNDKPTPWGNTGAQSVDIFAPGDEITSTVPPTQAAFSVKRDYRAVYVPVQVEVLEPEATATASIVTDALRELDVTRTAPILLVDASAPKAMSETPGQRAGLYHAALASLGYSDVTTWDVEAKGTPTASDAAGKVVLWFTGRRSLLYQTKPSMSPADARFISSYLDRGGRLALFSGEAASDLYFITQLLEYDSVSINFHGIDSEPYDGVGFLQQYFGLGLVDLLLPGAEVWGVKDTTFADIHARVPQVYRTYEESSVLWATDSDWLMPVDSSDSTVKPVLRQDIYAAYSGTSMAAPHVTGAASVLMARFPAASTEEIVARIENTAKQLPALKGLSAFEGRLDLAAALGSYPGQPHIRKPASKGLAGIGDYQLQWSAAAGGLPDATFEAELGKPVSVFDEGFESGTLAGFETTGSVHWAVTSDPADVRTGSFAARTGPFPTPVPQPMGGGWYTMELPGGILDTTVTVPPGGGKLTFQYWQETMPTDSMAFFDAFRPSGQIVASTFLDVTQGWNEASVDLPAGEMVLQWGLWHGYGAPYLRDGMGLDDIKLTALDWQPLATAPQGATSATVTIPGPDVDGAAVRLRGVHQGLNSAWAYATRLRITSDTVPPAAPTMFEAGIVGDGKIDVRWKNPGDVDLASVKILRRDDKMPTGHDDASATVVYQGLGGDSNGQGQKSVVDGPFKDGSLQHYAAFAVDKLGNVSGPAQGQTYPNGVAVSVVDKTPPPGVSFLGAEWTPAGPRVSWMLPAPDTYEKVKVLRRLDTTPTALNDPAATLVFEGDGASAVDYLLAEKDPTTISPRYAVYLIDMSGNVSEGRAVRLNAQPTPPMAMVMLAGGEPFVTSTQVAVDSFIAALPTEAQMRLFLNGDIDEDAPWLPFEAQTTLDLLPVDGPQNVLAQFKLADGTVLQAQASVYLDLNSPSKPEELSGRPWNAGVKLSWELPADPSISSYNIFQSYSSTGPFKQVGVAQVEPPPAVPESYGLDGPLQDPLAGLPGMTDPSFGPAPQPSAYVTSLSRGVTSYFRLEPVDAVGHTGPFSEVVAVKTGTGVKRFYGADSSAIAERIVADAFTSAETVVIAGKASPADALCAEGLAGAVDGPLLLTSASALDVPVSRAITRLRPKRILIVGNSSSVSTRVAKTLASLVGDPTRVERISAPNRYDLSAKVAEQISTEGGGGSDAFLVSGENYIDGMAVGPLAYAQKLPVLFTKRSGAPSAVRDAVAYSGISHLIVVDKAYWIPESAIPTARMGFRRIGGWDCYTLSTNLGRYAVNERRWVEPARIGVASSADPRAGVVAGAALGNRAGVLLLTPRASLASAAYSFVLNNRAKPWRVDVYGSAATVSENVVTDIRRALAVRQSLPF
jgi:subtilisin family serine protease